MGSEVLRSLLLDLSRGVPQKSLGQPRSWLGPAAQDIWQTDKPGPQDFHSQLPHGGGGLMGRG